MCGLVVFKKDCLLKIFYRMKFFDSVAWLKEYGWQYKINKPLYKMLLSEIMQSAENWN
jgi:hypothetical protein